MKVKLVRFLIVLLITTMSFSVLAEVEDYTAIIRIQNISQSQKSFYIDFPEQPLDKKLIFASIKNTTYGTEVKIDSDTEFEDPIPYILLKHDEECEFVIQGTFDTVEELCSQLTLILRYMCWGVGGKDYYYQNIKLSTKLDDQTGKLEWHLDSTGGESDWKYGFHVNTFISTKMDLDVKSKEVTRDIRDSTDSRDI